MADTMQKKPASKGMSLGKKNIAGKKTMNLAFHERSVNVKKLIPLILVIVIAALAFVKFGILDQTAKKVAALNEVSAKQSQLAAINVKLSGYDELEQLYGRYSYGWMTEAESGLVDRMEVITILEKIIDKSAVIEDFAINYNILNVNISGLSLDQTSTLVKELEADPQVTSASVYTAKSEDADLNAEVAMTIILEKEVEQ